MALERHDCEECWPGSSILHSTDGGSEDWKLLGNLEIENHKIKDTTTSIFQELIKPLIDFKYEVKYILNI